MSGRCAFVIPPARRGADTVHKMISFTAGINCTADLWLMFFAFRSNICFGSADVIDFCVPGRRWSTKSADGPANAQRLCHRLARLVVSAQVVRRRMPRRVAVHVSKLCLLIFLATISYNEYLCYWLHYRSWPRVPPHTGESVTILLVADPQILGEDHEPSGVLGSLRRWDGDRYLHKSYR